MAHSKTYTCDTCGYSALVIGGAGGVMNGTLQTVACRDCGELSDVWAGVLGGDLGKAGLGPEDIESTERDSAGRVVFAKVVLRCPNNRMHPVTPWPTDTGEKTGSTVPEYKVGPCPRPGCPGFLAVDPLGDQAMSD